MRLNSIMNRKASIEDEYPVPVVNIIQYRIRPIVIIGGRKYYY